MDMKYFFMMNTNEGVARGQSFFKAVGMVLMGLSVGLGGGMVQGQGAYIEEFNGVAGSVPTGWTVAANGTFGEQAEVELTGNGTLKMTRMTTSTAGANTAAFWEGDFGNIEDGVIADGIVTTQFLLGTNDQRGVIARSVFNSSANPQGYWSYVTGTKLVLAKDPVNHNQTILEEVDFGTSVTGKVELVFQFVGNNLDVKLYSLESSGDPFATISFVDSSYNTGLTGLRSRIQGQRSTEYDYFSVTAIPEPSITMLPLISGVLALLIKRK